MPQRARLHHVATLAMAFSALVGIVAMLLFITVAWPGASGRYVAAALIGSGVAFVASASIAVLSAARETYARRGGSSAETR